MQRVHIKEIESALWGCAFFINLLGEKKGQMTVLLKGLKENAKKLQYILGSVLGNRIKQLVEWCGGKKALFTDY